MRETDELTQRRIVVLRCPGGVEYHRVRRTRERTEDDAQNGQGRRRGAAETHTKSQPYQVQQAIAADNNTIHLGSMAKASHVADDVVVHLRPTF